MTACNFEKYFSVDTTVEITGHLRFLIGMCAVFPEDRCMIGFKLLKLHSRSLKVIGHCAI